MDYQTAASQFGPAGLVASECGSCHLLFPCHRAGQRQFHRFLQEAGLERWNLLKHALPTA